MVEVRLVVEKVFKYLQHILKLQHGTAISFVFTTIIYL